MTKDFVIENISLFTSVIIDFQNDAKFLVEKLASENNIEIKGQLPINSFFLLKNQSQSGILDENWKYFFHGLECRFENTKNGHIVDVILRFKDEFGALDPYFLGIYMKTSPKYFGSQVKIENDFEDGLKIIDILKENNLISNIEYTGSLILMYKNNEPVFIQYATQGIKLINR